MLLKVIQPKKVGKNATFKDETGATTFQAPIKVETTYRYTICHDSEGAEDGYFGEFGTNIKRCFYVCYYICICSQDGWKV